MKFLFVLASVIVLGCAVPYQHSELQALWNDFKTTHGRSYADESVEQYRYEVWFENLKFVDAHNARYEAGEVSYFMAQNHMSDLTLAERRTRTPRRHKQPAVNRAIGKIYQPEANYQLPNSVDWRTKGVVAKPRQQGDCGSCWAFATVAAMECMWARHSGQLVEMSEQQLVDCVPRTSCLMGGAEQMAYTYLFKQGMTPRAEYPYVDDQRPCKMDASTTVVFPRLFDFYTGPMGDTENLNHMLAQVGVVAAGIDVTDNIQFYQGGIFIDDTCDSLMTNHAVAIVGYGKENGTHYYIVRNSWGDDWGEEGYVRVGRNQKNNYCGLTISPTIPIM